MSRILTIDVGAGTQDILLYDSEKAVENCVKLVLPSRTVILAERVRRATTAGQDVFLHGNLMGGGPLTDAVRAHIEAGYAVYATSRSAKTLHDDLHHVRSLGVRITETPPESAKCLQTRDVDLPALSQAIGLFDVDMPDRYAVAVQDHGESITVSQRRFRFLHWAEFVRSGGSLSDLAYTDNLPDYLTRMRAVREDVRGALMMDTCVAAVLGAQSDERVAAHNDEGLVVVNIGNQHSLGVLCLQNRILGLFEHHTALMTGEKLAGLVEALQSGTIDNERVYEDNGHGAIVHPDYGKVKSKSAHSFQYVTVTGPNRGMARDLGYHFAAPHGDMMLSGCFGLLTAARWLKWIG